jgi:HEAT repeat protein
MTAQDVFFFSAGAALVMLAAFCMLLLRRSYDEKKSRNDRQHLAEITRSYMRRVAGQPDEQPSRKWSKDLKLSAVSHIHLLLRGGERQRLMEMAELDGLLRATLRRSRSWRASRRITAIRLLQQFGSEACIGRLREIFASDRVYAVRLEAAFALGSLHTLPPPRETIRILKMFERPTNRLDNALLRATAPHFADQLIQILEDDLPVDKRALVLDALGWSEDPAVLPVMEQAAKSEYPELRSAALRAAAKFGHPSVADWVIGLLSDPVAFVRIQAVNSCGALGLERAVPDLKKSLEDENIWVRLRAEHALDVLERHWPNYENVGQLA